MEFSLGDGVRRGGVLKWDGEKWTALGGFAGVMAFHGNDIYVGVSGAVPLVRFDGSEWRNFGRERDWDGYFPFYLNGLLVRGNDLFFAGNFTKALGVPANYFARYDATPATYQDWRDLYFTPSETLSDIDEMSADADGDGMSNEAEFVAGTDPRNAESTFTLTPSAVPMGTVNGGPGSIGVPAARMVIRFDAIANRTYTVQYRDGVSLPWRPLQHVAERDFDRTVTLVDDDRNASSRFYRVITPADI